MIIHTCIQGSDEWNSLRLGRFGGCDSQAVASNGKGLETKVYEKVAEILTGRSKDSYTNEDMERGHLLEDIARSIYSIQTGNEVQIVGYVELSEYVGVSPDGFVGDDGLVEIKCPNDANFVKFLYKKEIDSDYLWQVQHQMYVTDRKWCDLVFFNDNLDQIEIVRVERDEEKIAKIKEGLEEGIEMTVKILKKLGKTNESRRNNKNK
jgi:putative phage-type endonuclease